MTSLYKTRKDAILAKDPDYFRRAGREHYYRNQTVILEARKEKQEQKMLEMFGVKGFALSENEVTILQDPDPVGGYSKGVKIDHVAECLRLGAFTNGTIVEARGEKYKVVGISLQKLERIK